MKKFFHLDSHERIIFGASIIVTLLFALIIFSTQGVPTLTSISSDDYMPLATSLYEHGIFTYSTTTPYILEATHTPGYPLFLALVAVPWESVIPMIIIQALLLACTGVLLYRLFEGVFSSRVRFWGAFIFVTEPFTAYTATLALSETLFLSLFIGALLVLRRALERERLWLFAYSGILLGASILVRPIVEYLVPLIIICVAIVAYHYRLKRSVASIALLFLGVVIIVSPWAYRNHEAFGVWTLSTKGAYTLYFYYSGELLKYRDHLAPDEVSALLVARAHEQYPAVRTGEDLRSPLYESYLMSESIAIIRESPILFIKMYAASIATYFFSDGYRLLWYEITKGSITLPNITRAIVTGDTLLLRSYVIEHSIQATAFFAGLAFWGGAFVLMLIGTISGFLSHGRARYVVLACLVALVYFAFLTGLVAQARYRIVITPFLFMLASYGASVILANIHVKSFLSHVR